MVRGLQIGRSAVKIPLRSLFNPLSTKFPSYDTQNLLRESVGCRVLYLQGFDNL